jgi:hypothetical protein
MITSVLLIFIIAFIIGNIILDKLYSKKITKLPTNSKNIDSKILNSKIEILNKRISRIENKNN